MYHVLSVNRDFQILKPGSPCRAPGVGLTYLLVLPPAYLRNLSLYKAQFLLSLRPAVPPVYSTFLLIVLLFTQLLQHQYII